MNKNLVSVIIPTYNRSNFIKKTIKSVLNQTYQYFEIIIIDDGSEDNTKQVVDSFKDSRIKYHWRENCGHPGKVRNVGLKNAKGEFIAFLDSDDFWFPSKLKEQISILKNLQEILLVCTNGLIYGSKSSDIFYPIKTDNFISLKDLLIENLVITSSALMRREVVNMIGFMDENPILKSGQDYDYWLRLLDYKDKSIYFIKKPLTVWRTHSSSITYKRHKNPNIHKKQNERLDYIFNKLVHVDESLSRKIRFNYLYKQKIEQLKKDLDFNLDPIHHLFRKENIRLNDKIVLFLDKIFHSSLIRSNKIFSFIGDLYHFYISNIVEMLLKS